MGQAEAGSLAAQMQIQEGSKLESLGGSSLVSWNAFILALTKATIAQQTPLLTWVTPEGELMSKVLDLSKSELSEEAFIANYQGFRLYQPNLPAKLGLVQENSPAALAGLQVGDVVNAINGQAIDSWQSLVQAIAPLAQQRVTVDFLREGQALSLPVYLGQRPDSQTPVGYLGATVDFAQAKAAYWVERQYGFFEALSMAWQRLEDVTQLTLKALGRMLTGSLSLSNLSGPVSIASHAGESAQLGWMTFVGFLAFLSVSLGILNLLPIPMLDGGHLVYFTWEALTGRPVSEEWQYNAQKLGFALLMGLTGLALYNDLMRIQS
jgi:regulator of sigma E protease